MRTQSRAYGVLGLIAAGATALAGCGGVGVGSTDSVRVRVIDAATNAATVNMLVNSSSGYGDQSNPPSGDIGNVSPYLYAGTGTSTFSYISSTAPSTTPVTTTTTTGTTTTTSSAIPNAVPLVSGKFYSAYLIGRADALPTDASFLHVVVTDDNTTTPSDQAQLRVVNAAPNGGTLDVLVNGAAPAPSFSGITYRIAQGTFLTAPYVTVPVGTLNVQVNTAGTQTALSSTTSTSISTTAGRRYTLIITEPSAPAAALVSPTTPPTYGLQLIQDATP
ncbi:MAG: DUF4397 domain-containing protein [Armatimonadota bacterium]|nr:DUF4397 domain-containing protein [Armatimonadota bacterium]